MTAVLAVLLGVVVLQNVACVRALLVAAVARPAKHAQFGLRVRIRRYAAAAHARPRSPRRPVARHAVATS